MGPNSLSVSKKDQEMTFRRRKLPQFNNTMNSTAKAKEHKIEEKKKPYKKQKAKLAKVDNTIHAQCK